MAWVLLVGASLLTFICAAAAAAADHHCSKVLI